MNCADEMLIVNLDWYVILQQQVVPVSVVLPWSLPNNMLRNVFHQPIAILPGESQLLVLVHLFYDSPIIIMFLHIAYIFRKNLKNNVSKVLIEHMYSSLCEFLVIFNVRTYINANLLYAFHRLSSQGIILISDFSLINDS